MKNMNIPFVISTNISFCMKIMRMLFLRIRNIWFFLFFFGINCFYNKNKSFIRCFVEYTVHFSGGMSPFMKGGNMHANKYFSKHQITNTVFEIPPRQFIHSIKIAHLKNKTIYLIDLLGTNIDYKHRKRCTNLCVFAMNQLNVPLIYFLAANWFSVWMANAHGST